MAASWAKNNLDSKAPPVFSFTYDGKPSNELIKTWRVKRSTKKLDRRRSQQTVTYTDPKTGLEVRCVSVQYRDYPTVEWTVYLKNTGTADTPIIKGIQGLDLRLTNPTGDFLLHHSIGSPGLANDFQPLETLLGPNAEKRITAAGGRPTSSDMSYFNVEYAGQGMIIAVGWPGQWAATFQRDASNGLRIRAGQELTHLKLHPGEEIRTPLIVLQFWQGDDWIRSQNIWRRWMIAHNLPRPGGKVIPTHYATCWGGLTPRADDLISNIEGWIRTGIKLDYFALDTGWFPNKGEWTNTGTWAYDKTRFPRGIREVSDVAHSNGVKFVLWFEPERVAKGTWLDLRHPDWLLTDPIGTPDWPITGKLLNLGNPEALEWLTNHIDSFMKEQGVDVYRQDFNMEPLNHWRCNDAPDRQGITENKHVVGYLAFFDELLRRDPNRWIDTCASGGRRDDLETLRRAAPLLRSDYVEQYNGHQGHTYGLSLWVPWYGSGTGKTHDTYMNRCSICPAWRIGLDTNSKDLDVAYLRKAVDDFRQVEPYLMGDFYPLTPYSLEDDRWMAWQFDSPEKGGGSVHAFRRDKAAQDWLNVKLHGLDPKATYTLTDLDTGSLGSMSGAKLMQDGLTIRLADPHSAAIIIYAR